MNMLARITKASVDELWIPVSRSTSYCHHQSRGIRLFEIFSKESQEERRKQLNEELRRGYFDDFREFRDTKGKIFRATERLIPASHATEFPGIDSVDSYGQVKMLPMVGSHAAMLVCTAFRAGAQPMLSAWGVPFSNAYATQESDVSICELSLVEHPLMRMWPLRNVIVAGNKPDRVKYSMPVECLYYFGKTDNLRLSLGLTNRLTGYVFLLDRNGKVRWRGCGEPSSSEIESMIESTKKLLVETRKVKGT